MASPNWIYDDVAAHNSWRSRGSWSSYLCSIHRDRYAVDWWTKSIVGCRWYMCWQGGSWSSCLAVLMIECSTLSRAIGWSLACSSHTLRHFHSRTPSAREDTSTRDRGMPFPSRHHVVVCNPLFTLPVFQLIAWAQSSHLMSNADQELKGEHGLVYWGVWDGVLLYFL